MLVYLAALGATVAIEAALVWLASIRRADRTVVLRTGLFLNLCTHPLATLAAWHGLISFPVVEIAVILAEAFGYRVVAGQSRPRAAVYSVVANVASAAVGMVMTFS